MVPSIGKVIDYGDNRYPDVDDGSVIQGLVVDRRCVREPVLSSLVPAEVQPNGRVLTS